MTTTDITRKNQMQARDSTQSHYNHEFYVSELKIILTEINNHSPFVTNIYDNKNDEK